MTGWLHNMCVPPTSRLTLVRAELPGPRFEVDLAGRLEELKARTGDVNLLAVWQPEDGLRLHGARAALALLDAVRRPPLEYWPLHDAMEALAATPCIEGEAERELEATLEAELAAASIPRARVGVFLPPDGRLDGGCPRLTAAQCLAVLCRRSGPLYLPLRRLAPSLLRAEPLVLFFPEVAA